GRGRRRAGRGLAAVRAVRAAPRGCGDRRRGGDAAALGTRRGPGTGPGRPVGVGVRGGGDDAGVAGGAAARAHPAGAGGGAARGGRAQQPGHRRAARGVRAHRRVPPLPGVREAGRAASRGDRRADRHPRRGLTTVRKPVPTYLGTGITAPLAWWSPRWLYRTWWS